MTDSEPAFLLLLESVADMLHTLVYEGGKWETYCFSNDDWRLIIANRETFTEWLAHLDTHYQNAYYYPYWTWHGDFLPGAAQGPSLEVRVEFSPPPAPDMPNPRSWFGNQKVKEPVEEDAVCRLPRHPSLP